MVYRKEVSKAEQKKGGQLDLSTRQFQILVCNEEERQCVSQWPISVVR